ncbi:Flavodoxin [Nocardioides alpinus]|uniref:Flavodoxin n=1 Tax=Nocardioides alpinus TaxID=748909 RepID=A0A1I0ZLW4_9ACTN|nr:flavodoxin family protein [Nocardioides alpinus]PKH41952.1 flavodoxin/nitric oxide synthase [Nocardioides alpinus]SFB26457.1 Flavodoxin [Nocardioides alpinus]
MNTLLVHESHWGNTRAIGEAIAEGIASTHGGPVTILDVGEAPSPLPTGVDLLVVGGPTHAFSMSRSSTRRDARTQGAEAGHQLKGIREWLDALPPPTTSPDVATFDTRVTQVRMLPGSAARAAGRLAERHHVGKVVATESFFVQDSAGPLVDGELDRARAWGRDLAAGHADRVRLLSS